MINPAALLAGAIGRSRSLTFTALIVVIGLLGVVDIIIPLDDDFAPSAVPPFARGNPTMPA